MKSTITDEHFCQARGPTIQAGKVQTLGSIRIPPDKEIFAERAQLILYANNGGLCWTPGLGLEHMDTVEEAFGHEALLEDRMELCDGCIPAITKSPGKHHPIGPSPHHLLSYLSDNELFTSGTRQI